MILRSKSKHGFVLFAIFFLSFLSLPALSAPAAAQSTDLIEGARKEGQLVYYTGMEASQANTFASEFAKKYPFIKPEIFRATGEKVLTKYLTEARAKAFRADVFQTSVIQVSQLKDEHLTQKYVSHESQAYPDGFKDRDGEWTAFYLIPYVIAYNTTLVPSSEAPKSYEDLLNPKWKGKLGLEPQDYQWFLHVLKIMGKEKGLEFMKSLAQQDIQLRDGHGLLLDLTTAGEIALCVVCYSNDIEFQRRTKGIPVDWVRFKGPTIAAINAISVTAKAPHPNAAKLFVDFSLSKEGQALLTKFSRVPARPDVPADPPVLTQGLHLYPARPEEMVANYQEIVAQFRQIFKVP
jgi:iron(III) transport system substrate-binding protein